MLDCCLKNKTVNCEKKLFFTPLLDCGLTDHRWCFQLHSKSHIAIALYSALNFTRIECKWISSQLGLAEQRINKKQKHKESSL